VISESALAQAFWKAGKLADCPVIDMHGHMGGWAGIWFPSQSTESMVAEMDRTGVRMHCFCHHGALTSPDVGNEANIVAVREFPTHLRAYMGVNPQYMDIVNRDLDRFDSLRDVFVGFKFLAGYHGIPWDAPQYERAWKMAQERKTLLLGHTWGGPGSSGRPDGPAQVRKAATKYPDVRLLLGHSLHSSWDESIAIAREFPNVYLELTAVLDDRGVLEMFVDAGLAKKCLYGTDLPWFNEHYYIGAVLSAKITDEDRHDILHRNAEKLLAEQGVKLA
jgi:predicted TIM-barrel fold metal-dependent hydrolase